MSFKLQRIVNSSLCLGCGLCEAVAKRDTVYMHLAKNGFYEPIMINKFSSDVANELKILCPGICINCIDTSKSFCGEIEGAYEGWANDSTIRTKGSSGGVITALASHLLETKQVTGVLQVGLKEGHFMYNELKISRTVQEVYCCSSSRYAPSLMFDRIDEILNCSDEEYLFIGKPCDIMTLRGYVALHPELQSRIKYWISLVCAGMPSYNATQKLVDQANDKGRITSLKYRGEGWPGDFKVQFENGNVFRCSYNDSWGKVLGRDVRFRCKICPDGIGQYADIAVGDAWHTKNGYPDFTEQDGRSFLFLRNRKGVEMVENAQKAGAVSLHPLDINNLKHMQPYQYHRLQTIFYKVLPAYLITGGLLQIRRLRFSSFSFLKGCKIAFGTIGRYYTRKS